MSDLKTIPPTLRDKKRYIAYEVISESKVDFDSVSNAIWYSIINFLGEKGAAEADAWVIKNAYDASKQIGILKCSHTDVENVRAAMALVQKVGESRAIVRVLGISGTIKAARNKFFGEKDLMSYV